MISVAPRAGWLRAIRARLFNAPPALERSRRNITTRAAGIAGGLLREGFMHSVKLLTAILIGVWAQDATARDITVQFGQSIQAAVDLAVPGDRILVQPGTYREPGRQCPTDSSKVCAVVVSKNDISLVAAPGSGRPVILENS